MKILLTILTLVLAAMAIPNASAGSCSTQGGVYCDGAFVCIPFTVDVRGGEANVTCTTGQTGTCTVHVGESPPLVWCESHRLGDGTSSAAALPIQCTYGPFTPGGDTHCEGSVAKCDVLVHMYDQEDALNRYQVDCSGCGVNIGGGGLVECDLVGPAAAPTPVAQAAAPDPIKTHCWSAEDGSGCSTTVLDTCTYDSGTMGGSPLVSASCWTSTTGWCDVTVAPVQAPPLWCDGPRRASAEIGVPQPCTAGFAQTWCDVSVGPCDVRVTPWTAWGDQYVASDCRTGGAGPTCHTEVHTQGPLEHEHYCAW